MADSQTTAAAIPVAMCITDLEVGGAERMFMELALGLQPTEFAPHVFVLAARPRKGRDQFAQQLAEAGVPVEYLAAKHVWHVPLIVRRLQRYFKALRPQLVQSFLWHANIAGSLAARRAGVDHVLTGIRVAERRIRGHLWLAKRLAKHADYHVCVSRSVADFSSRVGGLPAGGLVVIPNGVRLERFPAEPADLSEWDIPADSKVVVAIGRLDPQKRFDRLLSIAPQLLSSQPNVHIIIVGEGPARSRLEQMRKALGTQADRVHLLGQRDDAANILAAADVLALTSRWEGMPNVLLEAMASSKPIVAADVEGVRELLEIEPTVAVDDDPQIYPANDLERLANQLLGFLTDEALVQRFATENRKRVVDQFSREAMVDNYVQLYRELLAKSTPSALFRGP